MKVVQGPVTAAELRCLADAGFDVSARGPDGGGDVLARSQAG